MHGTKIVLLHAYMHSTCMPLALYGIWISGIAESGKNVYLMETSPTCNMLTSLVSM